jgi:hypothetical protein
MYLRVAAVIAVAIVVVSVKVDVEIRRFFRRVE